MVGVIGVVVVEAVNRRTMQAAALRQRRANLRWKTRSWEEIDKGVKSPEHNAKACTQISDGPCRARSAFAFAFQSGGRSYFERPRLPAARPLRTRRRHDRSLWDRRLVPSFRLARVGPSFLSLGHMVRSREPADALLRRWGLATRLSRRHARRQDPLCLRRRNLR